MGAGWGRKKKRTPGQDGADGNGDGDEGGESPAGAGNTGTGGSMKDGVMSKPFTPQEMPRLQKKFSLLDTRKLGYLTMDDMRLLPELQTNLFRTRIFDVFEK